MAALKGLLSVAHHQEGGAEKQAKIILDTLAGKDRDLWGVALKEVGRVPEGGVVKLAAGLAKLPPAAQAALWTFWAPAAAKRPCPPCSRP